MDPWRSAQLYRCERPDVPECTGRGPGSREVLRAVIENTSLRSLISTLSSAETRWVGGGNMTRLAALTAGIDQQVPAVTLDLTVWFCPGGSHPGSSKRLRVAWQIWFLQAAWKAHPPSHSGCGISNHPNYEKDKVWTVAQFVPGQQGEQVMLEGAERTAILEQVKKRRTGLLGAGEPPSGLQKPPRREFYRTSRYRWQEARKMRASVSP